MASAGFETMMLRRVRTSAPVRAALCAAALLSVMAGFGLHPEPSGPAPAARAELTATASLTPPAHECPACLNAASALVAAPSNLAPLSVLACRTELHLAPFPPARLAAGAAPGRAPPAPVSS